MTTETVLTDEQIDAILASPGDMRWVIATKKERYVLFARAIEQAVLQSEQVQRLREDAELGQCAMRFVDRAGDYCKEDPAERICDQFHAAMADIVDRHGAMRGMPSGKYKINGDLK